MAPCGEEILTAGDQFSFSNDSIPGITDLDGECAYGSAEDVAPRAPWQCVGCSNPATILRYQKEMLDLLINELPECAYELSLKDLVDLPMMTVHGDDSPTTRDHRLTEEKVQRGIKGFLMKMFFPGGSRAGSPSSGSDTNGLTEPVTKDNGGKAAAGAAAAAMSRQRKKSEKRQRQRQQPAVLERDHTRRPRGCCPLFRNRKKK